MRRDHRASLWSQIVLATLACATAFAQGLMPKSEALVAIDTGQTLWIAPVNGKMQVIALEDYVIPRKDGFWRVWLQSESSPPDVRGVPLGKGKDVIAQQEKAPAENTESQTEGQDQSGREIPAESAEVHRQEVQFLSPNYISVYTETEQGEADILLKIRDARTGRKLAGIH